MLTGHKAFSGNSQLSTLSAILKDEPKAIAELAPDVPCDLQRVVQRCLRKDPARRFQVMADLAVELEDAKTDSGTRVLPATATTRRWNASWPLGLTAAVVLVAAGAWLLWRKPIVSQTPVVVPLMAFPGNEGYPTFSPDGNQVAFGWEGTRGDNIDIYVMPVGGATPLRLTTDPAEDTAPAWSPDGSRIAFLRRQGPNGPATIFALTPPVPNSEQRIAETYWTSTGVAGLVDTLNWFPDSKRLAIVEHDAKNEMNGITVVSLDRSAPKRLTWSPVASGNLLFPAVSRENRLATRSARGPAMSS